MYIIKKTERINQLIAITKSDSGISGPSLAKAHMELGKMLGEQMRGFIPAETTIVAILRGGIFFAEGMYFQMGCRFQTYDPKHEVFTRPATKNVILVDSVINTGRTLLNIFEEDMSVACCVINQKAVPYFNDHLFTITPVYNFFNKKMPHKAFCCIMNLIKTLQRIVTLYDKLIIQ